jgi:hypothetical protein
MSIQRLERILERCRDQRQPALSAGLVREAAQIQDRNQFSDNRIAAQREMRELLKMEMVRLGMEE